MRLSITDAIHNVLKIKFETLLSEPEFSKVAFKREGYGVSYNMIEYSVMWSQFAKFVDARMKQIGLDSELGVFSRKRSESFLKSLRFLVDTVTATDVVTHDSRFKTWCD